MTEDETFLEESEFSSFSRYQATTGVAINPPHLEKHTAVNEKHTSMLFL